MAEEAIPPPVKCIKNPMLMKQWELSEARQIVLSFLEDVNKSIIGKSQTTKVHKSETVKKIIELLEELKAAISKFPPQTQPQRFGNKAFRDWHAHLAATAEELVTRVVGPEKAAYSAHLAAYLRESFGNDTRIDFGTGHEVAFLMFLAALHRLGLLSKDDFPAVPIVLLASYLELVHALVGAYVMEPAGSHGAWSLDDFHFLPFLWGAAQLIEHPSLEPKHFPEPEVAAREAGDFLFMAAIDHINKTKTGPFAEHSSQLWNVSGVHTWAKVNSGLIKMFKVEVLGKFPVCQHFLFGQLLPFTPAPRVSLSATV